MENIFKNDINEGNKVIGTLNEIIKAPLKQKALSQIIFQHTYPTFFKKESHSTIALLSTYLAGKMNENVIKLTSLLDLYQKVYKIKPPKEKLISLECKMVEMFDFNFDIIPVHIYLLRLIKSLNLEIKDRMKIVEEVHSDNRVNYINYINGIFDPDIVAVSLLENHEINIFEALYLVKIDRSVISEIRRVLFKNT